MVRMFIKEGREVVGLVSVNYLVLSRFSILYFIVTLLRLDAPRAYTSW